MSDDDKKQELLSAALIGIAPLALGYLKLKEREKMESELAGLGKVLEISFAKYAEESAKRHQEYAVRVEESMVLARKQTELLEKIVSLLEKRDGRR